MSVAFRRESDEEHLEPKFELPIPPGPNLVTARGLVLLQEKAAKVRQAAANAVTDEERKMLLRDKRYWDTRLTTAEIAPAPHPGEVGIGSKVTIRLNGADRIITIVGGDEAEPAAGLIAFHAPIARALIGSSAGELLPFGGKLEAIEILAIVP
jgi:transcription elongation GreA/GreB family factor